MFRSKGGLSGLWRVVYWWGGRYWGMWVGLRLRTGVPVFDQSVDAVDVLDCGPGVYSSRGMRACKEYCYLRRGICAL